MDVVHERRSIAKGTEDLRETLPSNPPIVSSRALEPLEQSYGIIHSKSENTKVEIATTNAVERAIRIRFTN